MAIESATEFGFGPGQSILIAMPSYHDQTLNRVLVMSASWNRTMSRPLEHLDRKPRGGRRLYAAEQPDCLISWGDTSGTQKSGSQRR